VKSCGTAFDISRPADISDCSCYLSIFSNFICGQELRISVFDEDTFSANDPLGSRSLPILDLIETNAGQRPLAGNDTFNIYWEYMGISRDILFLYSLL